MEHLDLTLLAILAAIGIALLVLMRRSEPQKIAVRAEAMAAPVIPISEPVVVPIVDVTEQEQTPTQPSPAHADPVQAPIQRVHGLLGEKDSLVAAFVLQEIFAPPVAMRGPVRGGERQT